MSELVMILDIAIDYSGFGLTASLRTVVSPFVAICLSVG